MMSALIKEWKMASVTELPGIAGNFFIFLRSKNAHLAGGFRSTYHATTRLVLRANHGQTGPSKSLTNPGAYLGIVFVNPSGEDRYIVTKPSPPLLPGPHNVVFEFHIDFNQFNPQLCVCRRGAGDKAV
ncbi:hypothetical protein [Pseudomonas violetae]|uniref:Uncharacterized protein n=1 Tax=Pseudomonas violetae TaxID=2915813 RepID=A0ABT0ETJ6_9PSED|nr:hypothetical protein [Pseudomonas violetae]MCK1789063.1 hypothetical protein [Pseudomonas violetae]